MRKSLIIGLLTLTIIIGAFLRLYKVTSIPPGLNRDEAAIGYTAYSLYKTAKDEYGVFLPLSFKSFGDWKVPLYFYILTPIIGLFGLSEFTTRLPSVLFGIATLLLTYLLTYELFKHPLKREQYKAHLIALIAAASLAITPWHIFMSRNASESNIAVFLTTVGLWLFFKEPKHKLQYIFSFICFGLTLFTYHGNHIFTPLLCIGLLCIYGSKLYRQKSFISGVGIFLLLVFIILSQTLFKADKTKISGLLPTSDQSKVYEMITLRRLEYPQNIFWPKVLHNKLVFLVRTIAENYSKGFSPEFLYISGGTNLQHNIPQYGNLHFWQLFILPLAFFLLFHRKEKHAVFLLFWLLISPLTASITRDAPHTARMMAFLPLPAILTGYGLFSIGEWLKQRKMLIVGGTFISIIISIYFIIYLDQYFFHFPRVSAKNWGEPMKQMVEKVTMRQSKYKEIIINRPDVSPYIYFLFYQHFDPLLYQKTVVRYPETSEGFVHVKQLGNLHFENIGWGDELIIPQRLYVDWAESVPSGATNSATLIQKPEIVRLKKYNADLGVKLGDYVTSRLIDVIKLPDGVPYIYLIETNIGTPSATYTLP